MKTRNYQYTTEINPPWATTSGTLLIACRLAQRFSHSIPTVDQLRAEFGMSRATAYRWRSALQIARRAA